VLHADARSGRRGMLTLEQLRVEAGEGTIDTVVLAFTDMQGRLQGKRLSAEFFLDEVIHGNAEGCNYLLAVDVEMNTVDGYAMSSWERGYGDFVLVPALSTLRRMPWHEASALVIADLAWEDGSPVVASPRQILRAQTGRLAALGWTAMVGTELEFCVYNDSYEQAYASGYRDLSPSNQYNVDYSILGTSRVEPLLRKIRRAQACMSSRPRASATSVSTRSPSATPRRWPPATTTPSTRPARRRSPRRKA
jgi:glutamine synthetase